MVERAYPESPYKGLAAYSEEDTAFFFGREQERQNIINNLTASRLTLLYGESGVGKSSVLRAGVVPDLRRAARKRTNETGLPEFAVAAFNTWRDDPLVRLTDCVRDSVLTTLNDRAAGQAPASGSLIDTFRFWASLVGGTLLVILDQFEDYFIYHRYDRGEGSFAFEFSRLVNCRDLPVNFLISVREDTYARLDCFEDIPRLFDNALRIPQLDRRATRNAITMPIEQYNRFYGAGGKRISIEPELVETVLKGPSKSLSKRLDGGPARGLESDPLIETPFLQLVMTSLWREEMLLGSATLRLATLKRLRGVDNIVENHLSKAMGMLSTKEQAIAASVFHYLVTPSGQKVAYAASDLAKQADLDPQETTALVEKLTDGDNRILRPFALEERQNEQFYEISLDVLARPILDWRTRAEEKIKSRRKFRSRLGVVASVFVFLLAVGILLYYKNQAARDQAEKARQQQVAHVSGQILAQLYGTLVGSNDPYVATRNAEQTLNALTELRDKYRADGSRAGEGIALNNLAGFYRLLGESYQVITQFSQAESNYQKAQETYQQALEILTDALGPDNSEIATSLTGLAAISTYRGKYDEAGQLLERSIAILTNSLASDDRYFADALNNLAECYNGLGEYDKAQRLYKQALEIRRKKLGEKHPEFAESLYGTAWLYFELGKYVEAEPLFKQAVAIWQNSKANEQDVAAAHDALSALYRERGNLATAQQYLDLAWTIHQGFLKRDEPSVAEHAENSALLYDAQNNPNAETAYKAANIIWTKALGKDHPLRAYGLSNLALYYYKQGRPSEAEGLFDEALAIQRALPHSPELARSLFGLARLYADRGRYAEAEPLYQQALEIQQKAIPEHPHFADTLDAYADLLSKTDRQAQANEARNHAEQIRQIYRRDNPDAR